MAYILASISEAGYGEINRLSLEFDNADNFGRAPIDVIVKRFRPKPLSNAPAGSMAAVEHDRHMRAFVVEAAAYVNLSRSLTEVGLAAPQLFFATEAYIDKPFTLLLEDISSKFPRGANGELRHMSAAEISGAVRWLAGFHALFWEKACVEERGLWSRGSYWHLDQLGLLELEGVPTGYKNRYISVDEWQRLRSAAKAIDRRLSGRPASIEREKDTRFQTLLHGDAKPENMLCSARSGMQVQCAALDFAWTGEGYGMYDIMYLLWGEYTQDIVDGYLGEYHDELLRNLGRRASEEYTPLVMRQHFELCVLDFIRWWAGFRKGEHFWAMPWALQIMREVLQRLDSGHLVSESEYAAAIDREYPLDSY